MLDPARTDSARYRGCCRLRGDSVTLGQTAIITVGVVGALIVVAYYADKAIEGYNRLNR